MCCIAIADCHKGLFLVNSCNSGNNCNCQNKCFVALLRHPVYMFSLWSALRISCVRTSYLGSGFALTSVFKLKRLKSVY